jgi:hypothetical protein
MRTTPLCALSQFTLLQEALSYGASRVPLLGGILTAIGLARCARRFVGPMSALTPTATKSLRRTR